MKTKDLFNTVEQINKNSCTGCGLCKVLCPKQCIAMTDDDEGFRFPKIDAKSCIQCGKCFNMCPAGNICDELYSRDERKYFSGIISDKDILIQSSSGGVFGMLAHKIISMGGYVCGCIYNDDTEAIHIVTDKKEDIEKMQGSKYVQSRAEHCFSEISKLLSCQKAVLFTGTACQVAALRVYLGKDYDNLYCVEVLCHGVPSPGFFKTYKNHLEKKLNGKIKEIRFRDKRKHGWGSEHRTCVIYEKNGKLKEYRPVLPAYFSSFFYGLDLRESCYNCRYAVPERVADLTIGDYWGYFTKYKRRFDQGISVVGINTQKGNRLIDTTIDAFDFYDALPQEEAVLSNDNFVRPVKRPAERSSFYKDIMQKGYKHVWKRTYLTKTYRKKTLASVYGMFVPAKVRFFIHGIKESK